MMCKTKISFCLVLLVFLTLSACSDESGQGREFCRKASQIAGSLCLEGDRGQDGRVMLDIYATQDVTQVNLSALGGDDNASTNGSLQLLQPGQGRIIWVSNGTNYYLEVTLTANSGSVGKYAMLIRPASGANGDDRIYRLFLSKDYYAFIP